MKVVDIRFVDCSMRHRACPLEKKVESQILQRAGNRSTFATPSNHSERMEAL